MAIGFVYLRNSDGFIQRQNRLNKNPVCKQSLEIGNSAPGFPLSTLQSPKRYIVANEGLKGLEHASEQYPLPRDLGASAYVPR